MGNQCLNPLESGQWFRLKSIGLFSTKPDSLNPLESGQWFRLAAAQSGFNADHLSQSPRIGAVVQT
ncbi:uncharacterized protein Dmul_25990 [Desulfococcus multivorans]|nr:uncharacterized protein Dmul_25990 [Desulfococcus multivorans]